MEKSLAPAQLKEEIKARYGEAAQAVSTGGGCCCSASSLYSPDILTGLPGEVAQGSLGCGNPIALAQLVPGETVLDLGSGAGLDVLLAARRVGPTGKVYGLDMTDEMLSLARENQRKAGIANAEFLKGDIEAIPLDDCTVDVVISNCVINLAPEKDRVFAEIFRVLRPGGRLAVSDTVFVGPNPNVPEAFRKDAGAWGACIAGALSEGEYSECLSKAGFEGISLETVSPACLEGTCCTPGVVLPDGLRVGSAFIRARKP